MAEEDKVPDFLREFDDAKAARRNIYSNTLEAMKKRFPVEDDNYRLELLDPHYDGPQEFSLSEQKKALLNNRNLRTNLVGTWRLTDKRTGQVVDERKDSVMQVPYWTDRGTIINNGSEYTVISQSRLRPGVYARRKSNGEFEAQFNIKPGTGRAFHFGLNPETGVMTLQTGQGSVPLYQILRGMGVDNKEIAKYWGADVTAANAQKADPQAWNKLYRRMAGYKAVPNATEADKIQFVKDAVAGYEVDPEVVERTLGLRNVSTVTPALMLRASQKLLNISRGDEQPDNRDNPRFSKFYGVEDYFKERVEKNAGRLANTLLYKARRNGSLKSIQRNALNPWVDTIINGSGLAMPGEEANPLSTLEQMSRISKFGLGGIGSKDAVTMEARDVQGDYLGFVDSVQGPECFVPGSYVMSKTGYVKVEDVTLETELACLVDGRLEYHKPERVIAEDYDGTVYCAKTRFIQYKVTPNHRLWYRTPEGAPSYRFGYAGDLHGRHITLMTGNHAPYVCEGEITEFTVPHVDKESNHQKPDLPPIDIETWGAFLGWFISEGNVNGKNVRITQAKTDHKDDLISVLDNIPCPYSRYQDDFIISDMQLSRYLAPFGHSWEKRIPEYMFSATIAGRKALLDALCYGDGRRKHDTYTYCTISKGLAQDVERLCFTLGLSANIRFESDHRWIARRTGGAWAVHINMKHERELFGGNAWHKNNYFTENYSGKVYCVTVPGGIVYARFGDRGGHWTGNSEAIGVDVRASYKTFLGKDNKLYGEFIDNRTGKKEYVDIATASDRLVAFPGQDPNAKYVMAIKDGIPQRVPRDEVRYTVPSYAHMVASNTNMNPMPTGVQASRQFYGSKFWSQYLPQAKGETPLVDTLMPDGKLTWREYYGRKVGTLSSDVDGVVTKVDDDKVVIKGDDGKTCTKELTKNVPFNRLSQISYFPSVEVGQAVKAGDMVAHSNYTDKKTGAINMGQNLHVAIIPNGGSVSGDTNVLWETEDGSLTFGPICEVTPHAGMKSLASFCDDFRQELLPCNSLMAHPPDSKMYLVETLDGRRVKVTGSHSMMVFDGNTGMTTKRTDALVPGVDFIPVAKAMLPFGSTTGKLECRGKRKGTVLRLDIDEDLGWLFGIFLAEGCVCFHNGVPHDVSIAAVEPEIVSRILAFCKRYDLSVSVKSSDIPSKVHYGKKNVHGSVLIYSSALAHMLHSSCGRYAWLKRLPSLVFTAPRSFAESLVDGYWCGDGCVTKECSASTTSGVLADGICFLLGAIGVKATHREYWPSGGKYRQHLIHVFRDTISSFPTLSLPRKNDALGKLKGMVVKFSLDRVPYPDGSRHAACNSAGRPSCSRAKMLRLAEKYGDRRWIELAGRDVWWDVVKSVTEIESEDTVYDLDMQPAGTFIVNTGVIVHNSFEDAYVISEAAARRMATDRLYSFDHETRNGVTIGRDKFISAYPSKFTKQQVETLDENGIVKPGTILHRGDPMILSLGPKMLSSSDKALGKLSKALRNSYTDRSEVWEHDYEGKVVDTAVTSKGAKVNVSAQPPVRVGDKLSPMAGIKGVVGQIIPDDQMPRDAVTNQPYDMLMNTMGFLSRVAPNQIIEMNLAKIAKKTGKQIRMPQLPPPEGWYRWAQAQMKAAGVPETADVFDPATGRTMKGIGDGYMYTMAFHHLAEKKASAVGADGSYTQDEQPAKGGFSGGKKTSGMDLWAMLAHNVPDVIKDSQTIRGTRNDQYWRALQLGLPMPEPEEPFIYKKFLNTLRAGGINVTEKGSITKIMPQTDKDIDQLAQGRVLTSAEMVDSDFEPVKGGLFDLGKTGGMAGNQWSMIKLPEPVPNPIMEDPVRRVLGLTVSKMEDILAGREKLDGKTGGEAIRSALEKVDVDKRIAESRRGITTLRGQKRDDAVKVYRYLTSMKEQGLKPQDWMVSKVPVIPPAFRPVSKMGDVALVSDMNELYKDIIENSKNYEELRKDVDDSALADERLDIYNSVKAAYGLGEPITPENAAKGVKGAMRQVIGSRPKFGMFQNKVLSKAVGGVSRGVISPDINLDMDQCGIPEVMAWPMYKPYVMRELVRNGYPSVTAVKMIADKTDTARHVLEKVMSERPVILDRAPTWHKFNFMAFKPFLTDGDTIKVSPLIVSGFNADFDGDQMNAHVPSSEKAVRQAYEKMLPSKNLTSMTDMKSPRHTPSKEQIFGLYALTKGMDTSKPPKVFNSVSEAKQAYARGEIGPNDPIEILGR